MKEDKEYIDKRTGKPFPAKFIESMKKQAGRKWTKEEREAISQKSKQTYWKKRTFQDIARLILEMKPDSKTIKKLKEVLPDIPEQEITNRVAMTQTMIEKALKGDNYAFQVIRDTAGEKPIEKQEVVGAVANTYTQVNKQDIKQALIDAKKVLNELE